MMKQSVMFVIRTMSVSKQEDVVKKLARGLEQHGTTGRWLYSGTHKKEVANWLVAQEEVNLTWISCCFVNCLEQRHIEVEVQAHWLEPFDDLKTEEEVIGRLRLTKEIAFLCGAMEAEYFRMRQLHEKTMGQLGTEGRRTILLWIIRLHAEHNADKAGIPSLHPRQNSGD
jgi:hypothetical protein